MEEELHPRQLTVLQAIIEALLPPLSSPNDNDDDKTFWEHDLSTNPDYLAALQKAILHKLPGQEKFLLQCLLFVLSWPVGTALVFGSFQPLQNRQAFPDYNTAAKTALMVSLQASRFQEKRKIFSGLKRLICGLAFSFVGDDNKNPYWKAMGYPGPPWKSSEDEDQHRTQEMPNYASMPNVMVTDTSQELTVDVVIVGSGSGGGVAAAILAQAGYSVLIVEKGPYIAPDQTTWLEAESLDQMYESSSLLTSSDGNMMILAGACLGGGTTINWSCCLPLPGNVRKEWACQSLPQFGESHDEFEKSQLAVMERIGCIDTSSVQLNTMNQKLKEGCEACKYKWTKTGQTLKDTGKKENGFICFGDRYGNKQSGLVTFLHDAVQNGARILDNCTVQRILLEFYTAPNKKPRQKAVGIVGYRNEQKVIVRARKCVIAAAGALHTPCLLQRSWLKNPHIGQHLRLHPVTAVAGFYDQDIDAYLGAPMTGVCGEFEDGPNQDGYGAKIECPSAHTGLAAAVLPFIDPIHFRHTMLNSRKALPLIVLQRDSGQGQVRMSSDDRTPKVDYIVNGKDKQSMLCTLKGAIKILIASGAKEVRTCHNRDSGFVVPPTSDVKRDKKIQEYLDQIDERGMKEHEMGYFDAHQMGSCKMSATPNTGVVDTNGETWECDDLYVFDTSIFPTASGANPMLTVLTLSHMLSTRLAKRLLYEDGKLPTNPEHSRAMDQLRMCRMTVSQAMPWTRSEKLRFGIAWSAVLLLMAKLFWSPSMPFTNSIDRSEL